MGKAKKKAKKKRTKSAPKRTSARKLTAPVRDSIRELVAVMKEFLPLTSRSSHAVTFTSIFKKHGVAGYLKGVLKAPSLQTAWEKVIRKHPKLPFALIREIVPAAVSYRLHKRNPLPRSELDKLTKCLHRLGFDMRRELGKMVIDETVPEIKVPPAKLLKRLQDHPLVQEIASEPYVQFGNGHFNESVRKATERFEVRVQELSALTDIGKDLMAKAFKLDGGTIRLNALSTENERGIQEGYMHLTLGMVRAIRNVFSHGDENQRSPEECYEMLLFINWLFRQLPAAGSIA